MAFQTVFMRYELKYLLLLGRNMCIESPFSMTSMCVKA